MISNQKNLSERLDNIVCPIQQIAIPRAVTQGLQSPLAPPPPPTPGRHRIRNTEMQHAAYRKAPAVMPNAALSGSIASSLLRAPATLIARLAAWQRQPEERANPAPLSDYHLQNLGLSRGAVAEMARNPPWNRRANGRAACGEK